MALDATGSAFVTGSTSSTDFPTTPDAFDATHNGERDVFVARLNPTGSELVYSTFLGGNGLDFGSAIAVGRAGDVYVTGRTQSSNFPTTSSAFDGALGGYSDAFVVRINTRSSSRFLPFVTH